MQKNNVVVSEAEIEKEIEELYKYFPAGTPTSTLTPTSFTYSTLSAEQLLLVTATPTTTLAPALTPTVASTEVATKTPAPTATPVTEEAYKTSYQESLDHYKTMGFTEEMFRRIFIENSLYRERVKELVTSDVPHAAEQVWARHILVADEATAKAVVALLQEWRGFRRVGLRVFHSHCHPAQRVVTWVGLLRELWNRNSVSRISTPLPSDWKSVQ